MISTALPIETPEGITFTYELASLSDRGFAYLVDLLIRGVILLALATVIRLLIGPLVEAGLGLLMVFAFAVEWFYYVILELLLEGQSFGKRLLGLRVVKLSGHPIGFYDSVLRNLLRAADLLPATYAVGALSLLATRRFQRLGDLAAGTMVISERKSWFDRRARKREGALAQVNPRGIVLSNRERRLLAEFVQRKDRLHPERREQLAEILAEPYRRRFALPTAQRASEVLVSLHEAASAGAPQP